MYLAFHRLREFPFSVGSDEKFFYESTIHAEALANMIYTIQQRKGMVLITGEVGAGKTLLASMLATRLKQDCQTLMLKNPPQSRGHLVRLVAEGLGIDTQRQMDRVTLLDELEKYLVRMHRCRRLVAVVIDECQSLAPSILEQVRLLWNWEVDSQRLVQIILTGQPELRKKIQEPRWESLRQRIVLSYHLGRLSSQETREYVLHRLRVASESEAVGVEFMSRAIDAVYAATRGVPRLINVLCDNALLVAYARESHCIDAETVAEVLQGMTCWNIHVPVKGRQEEPVAAVN